jgi:hypothetical protein
MLSALILTFAQVSHEPLVPQLEQVRLQVGATSIAPIEVIANPKSPRLPDYYYSSERETPTGTLRWDRSGYEFMQGTTRTPLEFNPVRGNFLCADSEVAWFTSRDFGTQLKRVSLVTGRQLDAWNLPVDAATSAGERGGRVETAFLDEARLVVLFQEWTWAQMPSGETTVQVVGESTSIQLLCLDARTGATLWKWSVSLPSTKPQGMPKPSPCASGVRLVMFGSSWVVQASPDMPLVALDRATGAVRWQLERLWEFREPASKDWRQGNYPCRFGERRFGGVAVDDPALDEVRRPFDAARRGGAGLTSLVLVGEHESDQPILLAVAGTVDSRASLFDFVVPEASICGIGVDGSVLQVLPAPSPPDLGYAVRFADRVVVLSQNGELLCLAKSSFRDSSYLSVAWRRDFRSSPPAARFVLEPSCRPSSSLSRELAVLLGSWGRIELADERVARFPLSLVDPATGNARTAELVVPFNGSITTPEPDPDFDDSFLDLLCRQWLGVTGVYVGDGRLRLSLSNGLGADGWTVTFAIADVLAAR